MMNDSLLDRAAEYFEKSELERQKREYEQANKPETKKTVQIHFKLGTIDLGDSVVPLVGSNIFYRYIENGRSVNISAWVSSVTYDYSSSAYDSPKKELKVNVYVERTNVYEEDICR